MEKSAVFHMSEHNYCYPVSADTLSVRLRVRSGDCEKALVYFKNLYDHSDHYYVKEMQLILSDSINDIYETGITVKEKHFKYYFELHTRDRIFHYTADGFIDIVHESNCFYYPRINRDDVLAHPGWAEGEIIYQVLIDRFHDGDPGNNPPGVKPPRTLPDRNTYYGGDFQGLIERLDHIESLGTRIIYLSPLFRSPSYHKYDVADYYRVEQIYGGEEGLLELVEAAHARGLKIVLDAVFNHCSVENELFQDVIARGGGSRYRDWFLIESFPVDLASGNYDTFAGQVPSMPRFDTCNPGVIDYLVNVAVHWTEKLNIDGWRLDVADEVSHTLWKEFRKALKSLKRDILIIGEVWNHASRWLQGDEFDTVTNYKFRKWLLDFARGDIDAAALWNRLEANKMLYKTPYHNYLVNLIGSHDTARSATCLQDDRLHYLALLTMLAMDGMPLIYYGDEIAMPGAEDPDNRRAMQWDQTGGGDLELIRQLGTLRKNSVLLRKGRLRRLPGAGRVLAFDRYLDDESVTVVANFSDKDIRYAGRYSEILTGRGSLTRNNDLHIDPYSLVIAR